MHRHYCTEYFDLTADLLNNRNLKVVMTAKLKRDLDTSGYSLKNRRYCCGLLAVFTAEEDAGLPGKFSE